MSSILKQIIVYIFAALFLVLPLMNSRILSLLGLDFVLPIDGNYEFTKVMFFNIYSSIVIVLYFLFALFTKQKLQISKKSFIFLLLLFLVINISTLLSESSLTSFFGNAKKGHGFLMWNNLIGLSLILFQILDKKVVSKMNSFLVLSGLLVAIIGLKEYFSPSFAYGDLGNRLLSTFGHPNYVALFLLIIIPYINESLNKTKNKSHRLVYSVILLIILIALFLTKSVLGIFLYFSYLIYTEYRSLKNKNWSLPLFVKEGLGVIFLLGYIITLILGIILIMNFYPEKLHSFISRFYIWETTLSIIFSDIKIFFAGIGSGNLVLFFDNFKHEYLYIFENIGFKADRPHNIFLNFWVHFGIGGFILLGIIYKHIYTQIHTLQYYHYGLVLSSIFLLFNFASIATYIVIIYFLVLSLQNSNKKADNLKNRGIFMVFLGLITLFAIGNASISYTHIQGEIKAEQGNYTQAIQEYPFDAKYYYKIGKIEQGHKLEKFPTENYYVFGMIYNNDILQGCNLLIASFPTVENYFYCGKMTEKLGYTDESINYYTQGLEKLPDLWVENSEYFERYLIKNFVTDTRRFMSPKYSDLQEILEKVGEK